MPGRKAGTSDPRRLSLRQWRASHDIGDHKRRESAENPGSHAVEHLDTDQPEAVIGEGIEHGPDRQDGEPGQEQRLASPSVGSASYQQSDRQHHQLGGDNAGRHHGRCFFGIGGCQLLSHQWQHRCIGEMEQHDAQTEDDQRARLEQDTVAGDPGRGPGRVWFLIEVSCPIVVDGGGWDREHRDAREHGEDRDEKKDGAL